MTEMIRADDGHEIRGTYVRTDGEATGIVVFVHGLGGDRDEVEALFEKSAAAFADRGLNSYRFDFRGNGDSPWPHERMTIAGETSDLTAVVEELLRESVNPMTLVAASFGALSAGAVAHRFERAPITGVVLWNPVVDVRKTFVDPGTPWSRQYINEQTLEDFHDGAQALPFAGLELGRGLLAEMTDASTSDRLRDGLASLDVPTLVFHGTADDKVPFEYTLEVAAANPHIDLRPLEGASHGFTDRHEAVIDETGAWISSQARVAA
jgi:pimeloyl-ACP methyl ester carboxylesterase